MTVLLCKAVGDFKSITSTSRWVNGLAVLPLLLISKTLGIVSTLIKVLTSRNGSDNILDEHTMTSIIVITIETVPALAGIIIDVTIRTPKSQLITSIEFVKISFSLVGTSKGTSISNPFTKKVIIISGKKFIHIFDEFKQLTAIFLNRSKVLCLVCSIEVVETKSELISKNVDTKINNIMVERINITSSKSSHIGRKKKFPGLPEIIKRTSDTIVGNRSVQRINTEGGLRSQITDARNRFDIADIVSRSTVDNIFKNNPSVLNFSRLTNLLTITTLDVIIKPFTSSNRLRIPTSFEHSFIHNVVLTDSFHSNTNTVHSVVTALTTIKVRLSKNVSQITPHTRIATKVMEHAPDPFLAIVVVLTVENRAVFSEQVKKDHTVIRDTSEVSTDLRFLPEASLVDEEPSLHKPDCIRITRGKTLKSTRELSVR